MNRLAPKESVMAGVPSRSCVVARRDRCSALVLGLAAFSVSLASHPRVSAADVPYKRPPQAVVDLLDAPPPPIVFPNPSGDMLLLVDNELYPPIELLSRPFLKLAGIRVDAAIGAKRREFRVRGLTLQSVDGGKVKPVALPAGARFGFPTWSFDGKRFAFTRDMPNGVELWVADGRSGEAKAIAGLRVTDMLGAAVQWTRDGRHLLVRAIPAGRGAAPAASAVPVGPHTDETAGKRSRMATFRDLLTDAHDEDLFEHYGTVQLALVDCESGKMESLGAPGLYGDVEYSPSGEYLLVTRYRRPFSFRVPAENF